MPKEATRITTALLATVLAWLVPGAGHFYLGRRVRGAIIFLVIGATFWSGMAIGGALTMDYYNNRGWFIAQMCAGAHGLVGWQRQKAVYDPVFDQVAKATNLPIQVVISHFMRGISESNDSKDPNVAQVVGDVDAALQEKGVAMLYPTENVARAYAGVAGMLNLLCIIDAILLSCMGIYGEPKPSGPTSAKEAA